MDALRPPESGRAGTPRSPPALLPPAAAPASTRTDEEREGDEGGGNHFCVTTILNNRSVGQYDMVLWLKTHEPCGSCYTSAAIKAFATLAEGVAVVYLRLES